LSKIFGSFKIYGMKALTFSLSMIISLSTFSFPIPQENTQNLPVAWIENDSGKKNCAFVCRPDDESVNFGELGTGTMDGSPAGVYPVFVCKAEVSIPELGYKGFLFGHNRFTRSKFTPCKVVTPDDEVVSATSYSCLCIKYMPRP
jgi:hypothetical protein